jgi:hypothetical protein
MALAIKHVPDWGAAWRSIVDTVLSSIGQPILSRWVWQIMGPVPPLPGGIQVTQIQNDLINVTFWAVASEFGFGRSLTAGGISRTLGFSNPIVATFGPPPNTIQVIAPALDDARKKILTTGLTPGAALGSSYLQIASMLKNGATAAYNFYHSWADQTETMSDALVVVDNSQIPQPQTPQPPAAPSYSPNGGSALPPIQVQVIIPQFQDISFRQGQAVFSVETNTSVSTNGAK